MHTLLALQIITTHVITLLHDLLAFLHCLPNFHWFGFELAPSLVHIIHSFLQSSGLSGFTASENLPACRIEGLKHMLMSFNLCLQVLQNTKGHKDVTLTPNLFDSLIIVNYMYIYGKNKLHHKQKWSDTGLVKNRNITGTATTPPVLKIVMLLTYMYSDSSSLKVNWSSAGFSTWLPISFQHQYIL